MHPTPVTLAIGSPLLALCLCWAAAYCSCCNQGTARTTSQCFSKRRRLTFGLDRTRLSLFSSRLEWASPAERAGPGLISTDATSGIAI